MSTSFLLVFFFLLLSDFLNIASGDHRMIIMYGYPTSIANEIIHNNTNWTSCVKLCYEDDRCVLAHSLSIDPTDCYIYQFNDVASVSISDVNTNQGKVAIKDGDTTICPKSISSNFPIKISTQLGSYTVSISSDSIDQLDFVFEVYNCPDGWLELTRPNGKYCISIVQGTFTKEASIEKCTELNATLPYFISQNESSTVIQSIKNTTKKNQQFWTDGVRTEECQIQEPMCNTFEWTHNTTIDTEPVISSSFLKGEPSGTGSGHAENCLTIKIKNKDIGFNDSPCVYNASYLCGKMLGN